MWHDIWRSIYIFWMEISCFRLSGVFNGFVYISNITIAGKLNDNTNQKLNLMVLFSFN